MGVELRLRADDADTWPPTVITPETFLRRLPQLAVVAPRGLLATYAKNGVELRDPRNTTGMPDVQITVEARGFYILDNSGELANHVLAELVRYMIGTCRRVTIEEP
jgi:hypothetical protein